MRLLALAAAGLAVAQAFVIVPEIAKADSDLVEALPYDAAPLTADHQSLRLACPGCPVLRGGGHHGKAGRKQHHRVDIPNHLELSFTVDHGADGAADRLLLNDFELYPNADPWHGALTAPQVADVTEKHHHPKNRHGPHHVHDVQLGYSLAVRPVAKQQDGQELQLIDVELQVIEIGNFFVDGIPTVKVGLLKSPSGALMIASAETQEQAEVPEKVDDCETLVCRWKAMVHQQLDSLKKFKQHCGGRKKGQQDDASAEPAAGDYRVVYRHRTWSRLFRNITTYVLLPVLIGIVAGVSISILGMVAGTFVICLWRLIYRRQSPFARRHCRRRGRSCRKANAAEVAIVAEEKTGLMEEQEAPPQYEEPEVNKEEST